MPFDGPVEKEVGALPLLRNCILDQTLSGRLDPLNAQRSKIGPSQYTAARPSTSSNLILYWHSTHQQYTGEQDDPMGGL